jgi:rhomboid protease GluP
MSSEQPSENRVYNPAESLAMQEKAQRIREIRESQDRFFHLLMELTPRCYVTAALIGGNIFIFILMYILGVRFDENPIKASQMMIQWGSNLGILTRSGEYWRLLTSMFLHFGLLHIAMNMFCFYQAGPLVERLFGNVGFAILYFFSGIVASLCSSCYFPFSNSAGASGAICGVLGGLFGFIIRSKKTIPVSIFKSWKSAILSFIGLNVVIGFLVPQIDFAAHGGGFIAGFILGLIFGHPLTEEGRSFRLKRGMMILIAGLVMIVSLFFSLPKDGLEYISAVQTFHHQDKQMISEFQESIKQYDNGELSIKEFWEVFSKEFLSEWRAAKETFQAIDLPDEPVLGKLNKSTEAYILAREMSFARLARYLAVAKDGDQQTQAELLFQFKEIHVLAERKSRDWESVLESFPELVPK